MKRLFLFGCVGLTLAGILIFSSCAQEKEVDVEQIRQDTQESIQSAAEWIAEKAEEVYAEMKDGVQGLKADFDDLKNKTPEEKEAKEEWNQRVEDLEIRIDKLGEDLEEFRHKSGDAWENRKDELKQTMENIREEIKELKKKIE